MTHNTPKYANIVVVFIYINNKGRVILSETGSNSIRSSGRMEHIDIARGICMISIILGHLGDKYLDHFAKIRA